MKICFIAAASSIHTARWANAMAERGHEIFIITQHKVGINKFNKKINIFNLPIANNFGYYLNYPIAKKIIKKIRPDIINTHYASGYGTLSRLINFKPTLLSVWGSDVYDFPYENFIKKQILIKNLEAATEIASTSEVMKKQVQEFIKNKKIHITPFGVDINRFIPDKSFKNKDIINIGIVKSLETKYGIEYLIKGVKILIDKLEKNKKDFIKSQIKLTIVGKGEQLNELIKLTKNLGIENITEFIGAIPHKLVPQYLNTFDIFCAPSILESFGVAVIEASACALPVIVSDVGGLPEVVDNNITGYVIPPKRPDLIGDKLYKLILNEKIRKEMGLKGREKVKKMYDWEKNVEKMEKIYEAMIKKYGKTKKMV